VRVRSTFSHTAEGEWFGLACKVLGRVHPDREAGSGSVLGAVIKVGAGCTLAHSWGCIVCCELGTSQRSRERRSPAR